MKVSITDPEAPLGRDKEKVFGPMYTTQFVVDTASLLILSFDVFAQVTDAGTLAPMLDRTEEVTGAMLIQISTDAGYVSLLDLQECEKRDVRLVGPMGRMTSPSKSEPKRVSLASARISSSGSPKKGRIDALGGTNSITRDESRNGDVMTIRSSSTDSTARQSTAVPVL